MSYAAAWDLPCYPPFYRLYPQVAKLCTLFQNNLVINLDNKHNEKDDDD